MENIKLFNASAKHFLVSRKVENERQIERALQVLSSTSDLSVFDSGLDDTTHFYVNLRELLIGIESQSDVAWSAVATLLHACKNLSARRNLTEIYQFMPILTRFLASNPPPDKEIQLLQLMEELTYGIVIPWQAAHLSSLMSMLTSIVMSDVGKERVNLSLRVLVNLCYDNLPAVYALMRTIDIKRFLRTLLALQSNTKCTEIQVLQAFVNCVDAFCAYAFGIFTSPLGILLYPVQNVSMNLMEACEPCYINENVSLDAFNQVIKLLIILKDVTTGLPPPDESTYFKSVIPTLRDALITSNSSLMKQTVCFHKQMTAKRDGSLNLDVRIDYNEELQQLISSLLANQQINSDCMDILFDYLCDFVDFNRSNSECLYAAFLELAFQWISPEMTLTNALRLVAKVTVHVANSCSSEKNELNGTGPAIEILERNVMDLSALLRIKNFTRRDDSYQRLTAVLDFLSKFVKLPRMDVRVSSSLDPTVFQDLFQELCQPEPQQNDLYEEEVYTFYVQAITFLHQLSDMEAKWFVLYTELLLQRKVQYILAVAIYFGAEVIKKRALELTTTRGFSLQCLGILAGCMAELNKLVVFSPLGKLETSSKPAEIISPMDLTPILTITQEGHVNSLLEKVEQECLKNNNTLTSSVIELYQFKMAAMAQTTRTMQSSLEAADRLTTSLQHSAALTRSEVGRLHQLLHTTHQRCEALTAENSKQSTRIGEIEERANDLHKKHSQALQNLKSKTRIIDEMTMQLDDQKQKMAALEEEMKTAIAKLESQLQTTEQSLKDCRDELVHSKKELELENQKFDQLKKDYMNQAVEYSKLEKAKAETDAEAEELNKQLLIISQLAMKRKDK